MLPADLSIFESLGNTPSRDFHHSKILTLLVGTENNSYLDIYFSMEHSLGTLVDIETFWLAVLVLILMWGINI